MQDVIIIGAGLAGLACAKHLAAGGVQCQVIESSDGVGGRVRTDLVDGFQLDRGFQVLLTAYPEAQAVFDYESLRLQPFEPGALVQRNHHRHLLSDPWRRPSRALESLFSPIGTLFDKLRVALMRFRALHGIETAATSTYAYLDAQGFSSSFIESFWRPFFAGIFLERELVTSSRMAEFVFRMMASGDTVLPAEGMGAMSRQLAEGVAVRLNARVKSIEGCAAQLESGERLVAKAVVVATEGPEALRLAGLPKMGSRSVSNLYFAADHAPIAEGLLVLNGEMTGPVNNLCVPSNVAPTYAPAGAALISASVLGMNPDEVTVREQLATWFGPEVHRWRHLRTYRIAHAQPEPGPRQFPPGMVVCGDHCESPSLQGALVSGRRAAELVMKTL